MRRNVLGPEQPSFNGANGSEPYGGLIADAKGDLFGTTQTGGADGDGTVFDIVSSDFVVHVVGVPAAQAAA